MHAWTQAAFCTAPEQISLKQPLNNQETTPQHHNTAQHNTVLIPAPPCFPSVSCALLLLLPYTPLLPLPLPLPLPPLCLVCSSVPQVAMARAMLRYQALLACVACLAVLSTAIPKSAQPHPPPPPTNPKPHSCTHGNFALCSGARQD